jgi:hypothetical protein
VVDDLDANRVVVDFNSDCELGLCVPNGVAHQFVGQQDRIVRVNGRLAEGSPHEIACGGGILWTGLKPSLESTHH